MRLAHYSVAAGLWMAVFAGTVAAAPQLTWVTPRASQYGPFDGFPPVAITVQFANTGTEVLELRNCRSTCTCTEMTKFPEAAYAPGATGEVCLILTLEPKIHRTSRGFGFLMLSNDPEQPVASWGGNAEFIPLPPEETPADNAPQLDSDVMLEREHSLMGGTEAAEAIAPDSCMPPAIAGLPRNAALLNAELENDAILAIGFTNKVCSFWLTGEVELLSPSALVRVVLVDTEGHYWLVAEAYTALNGLRTHSLTQYCEETCLLPGVTPKELHVQVEGAAIDITQLGWYDYNESVLGAPARLADAMEERAAAQRARKVTMLNARAGTWRAGITALAMESYDAKCRIFPNGQIDGLIPNLQGLEYYRGGVHRLYTHRDASLTASADALPPSWSWLDRHGVSWMPPVKDQGERDTSWAFALTAALEGNMNLYFNRRIDLDLSEEDLVTFAKIANTPGAIGRGLDYCLSQGVVDRECCPYVTNELEHATKRSDWKKRRMRCEGWERVTAATDTTLKELIMTNGVVPCVIGPLGQAMALVGWRSTSDNKTVWILKNSFGRDWGEHGYYRVAAPVGVFSEIYALQPPYVYAQEQYKIRCADRDGDGYCNWGLSTTRPKECCSCTCRSIADPDDTNPSIVGM